MTLLTALKLVSKHSRSLQKEWNSAKKMSMPCSASLSVVAKRRFSTLVVMSSKNSSPNEGSENTATNAKFRIPQHHPTKLDQVTLVVTRTMKAEDIGNEVSFEVMEKANTKRRIGVNISLMIFTFFGSIYAIWQGKRAMKTDNIYEVNKRR